MITTQLDLLREYILPVDSETDYLLKLTDGSKRRPLMPKYACFQVGELYDISLLDELLTPFKVEYRANMKTVWADLYQKRALYELAAAWEFYDYYGGLAGVWAEWSQRLEHKNRRFDDEQIEWSIERTEYYQCWENNAKAARYLIDKSRNVVKHWDSVELPPSTDQEPVPAESGGGLESTFQKLLLIRFLQLGGVFPKKQVHMSQKQELEFIGALTGLTYENHLKKAKPAVEELLDYKLKAAQLIPRIKDLRIVKDVVLGMELTNVITLIEEYETKFTQLLETV